MSKILQFLPDSSSFVEWVAFYDGRLYVRLRDSGTYRYTGVAVEDYRGIENASSVGSAYNAFRARMVQLVGNGAEKISPSDPELMVFKLLQIPDDLTLQRAHQQAWRDAAVGAHNTGFFV